MRRILALSYDCVAGGESGESADKCCGGSPRRFQRSGDKAWRSVAGLQTIYVLKTSWHKINDINALHHEMLIVAERRLTELVIWTIFRETRRQIDGGFNVVWNPGLFFSANL